MASDIPHFRELDGLRGYLALWVVFGHIVQFSPIYYKSRIFSTVDPGYAVTCFMILSGFVITHLLIIKREIYGVYIMRRFLRLFPVFVLWTGLGWLTFGLVTSGIAALPWANDPAFVDVVRKFARRGDLIAANPLAHLLAHLTMLHGAVPNEMLPEASRTFLSPAWSISLEWQFYLVAPLLLPLFGRGWRVPLLAALVMAGMYIARHRIVGTFDEAFLGNSAIFLLLGMASRLAFPSLTLIPFPALPTAAFAVLLVYCFVPSPLRLLPWALLFPFLVDGARGNRHRLIVILLDNRFAQWAGKMSYSIYLSHISIFSVAVYLVATYLPSISPTGIVLILTGCIVPVLLLSAISYHFVERPGVMLGRSLARRLERTAVPAANAVAVG